MKTNLQKVSASGFRKSLVRSRSFLFLCLVTVFWLGLLGGMQTVVSQNINSPSEGFESGSPGVWVATGNPVNTAGAAVIGSDVRTGVYAANFAWNRTQTQSQSAAICIAGDGVSWPNYNITVGTTVHFIAWVKSSPAMPAMSGVFGVCMMRSASKTAASNGTNVVATATSNNTFGTVYNRYSISWKRDGVTATSVGNFCPKILMGTFPTNSGGLHYSFFMDDLIIYTSTNDNPTDLTAPSAPTGSSVQDAGSSVAFTCGIDSNTGVQSSLFMEENRFRRYLYPERSGCL